MCCVILNSNCGVAKEQKVCTVLGRDHLVTSVIRSFCIQRLFRELLPLNWNHFEKSLLSWTLWDVAFELNTLRNYFWAERLGYRRACCCCKRVYLRYLPSRIIEHFLEKTLSYFFAWKVVGYRWACWWHYIVLAGVSFINYSKINETDLMILNQFIWC